MEETAIMEAKATLRYARISARKVKIVADLIRGKDVDEALAIVKFTPKASSVIIEKLLKSAIANAENNHDMKHENLYVAEIYANQGKENVILYVKDNGIGIRQGEITRVFEKGFTGTNGRLSNKKSTGIGLYLCKKLCNKLGIGIELNSVQNEGTEIRLVFPQSSYVELK